MKKVKKNVFGMGLALSMMLGMVFALVPQETKANMGCPTNLRWVMTECKGVDSGIVYGYSNDCHPGSSNCCDNDCSRFNQ